MADLALVAPPPRAQLLRQVRGRLADLVPGLRVVAEGVLGSESSIDFVGVEPPGRVVLVLVGDEGSDLALVARAVAQRAWVEARLGDWLQLAPSLGIHPEAGARVVLVCPGFGPESREAARALGTESLLLARYRCVRNGSGIEALLERATPDEPKSDRALEPQADSREPAPDSPHVRPAGRSEFRTGLSEADLGLSSEEMGEFE